MIYDHFFSAALAQLHEERRYRVFAELERIAGRFPRAIWRSPDGPAPVVIWCSNDYLGMGQRPKDRLCLSRIKCGQIGGAVRRELGGKESARPVRRYVRTAHPSPRRDA